MFAEFGSWIGFLYFQLKISENLLCLLNKLASLHPFKVLNLIYRKVQRMMQKLNSEATEFNETCLNKRNNKK